MNTILDGCFFCSADHFEVFVDLRSATGRCTGSICNRLPIFYG